MKYLYIVVSLMFSFNTIAQGVFNNPTVTVMGATYLCEQLNNTVLITNKNNKLHKAQQIVPSGSKEDVTVKTTYGVDRDVLLRAIFSASRLRELKNENLMISYYLDDVGNILEMRFMVKNNTLFTALELYKIEVSFKKSLKFKLQTSAYKGANYVYVSLPIAFKYLQ